MAKILLISGGTPESEAVALALRGVGFHVLTTPDGLEALARLPGIRPDVVIVNDVLPTLDGWEVCSHLRQSSDVPIIMLGSDPREQALVRALTLGADFYLIKPCRVHELVARVQALLRRSSPSK